MKTIIVYCCLLMVSAIAVARQKLQEINPIIHDQSFVTPFGTTTIVTSALNLLLNKKPEETKNAFNLYSYPNYPVR